jgi:hypothetical protein
MCRTKKFFTAVVKIVLLSLFLTLVFFEPTPPAKAGSLLLVADRLNTYIENQTSSVTHTIIFTPANNIPLEMNSIILTFPDADDGLWCRAAGGLKWRGSSVEGATPLPGGDPDGDGNCVQGVGPGSSDKITVVFDEALTAGVKYGVFIRQAPIFPPPVRLGTPGAANDIPIVVTTHYGGGGDVDSGALALAILSNNQATITATVDPTLTFDLDTATSDTETPPPYGVDLGILTSGTVATSDGSAVNSIWVDLMTNAASGATVTVQDANLGLQSAATGHTIATGTATLTAGTEGYGVCVKSVTQTNGGPLAPTAPYDGPNCDYTDPNHDVGALDNATPQEILNTSYDVIEGGRAEVLIKAAISNITPAAGDYSDTITFIATGSF